MKKSTSILLLAITFQFLSCINRYENPFQKDISIFFGNQPFRQIVIPEEYKSNSRKEMIIYKGQGLFLENRVFKFYCLTDSKGKVADIFISFEGGIQTSPIEMTRGGFVGGVIKCIQDGTDFNGVVNCIGDLYLLALMECATQNSDGCCKDKKTGCDDCWMNDRQCFEKK